MKNNTSYNYCRRNLPVMLFSILVWILSITAVKPATAQSRWNEDINAFDNFMTITGYILLNGEELTSEQIEVACFIDDQCRGTIWLKPNDYLGHSHACFLSIWGSSSDNGKPITVKIYDHTTSIEYETNEKPPFQYNEYIGIESPYEFTITTVATYNIAFPLSENGTVTGNVTRSLSGEAVALTITPDNGYELNAISAFKTGAQATTIHLSGTGNMRTFTMPGHNVTIQVSFKKTADQLKVEEAKSLIQNASFIAAQTSATTQANLLTWLVERINSVIRSTNVVVRASDVTIGGFTAAKTGTEDKLAGTNGEFTFSVSLKKGNSLVENVANKEGEITASSVLAISIGTFEYGSVSSDKNIATASETVTLTISPNEGYDLNTVSAYQTGNSAITVSLSGTGKTRTFTMPAYNVTVNASFKKTADLLAVETAKLMIETSSFVAPQALATTQSELLSWLISKINTLISSTGIIVTPSNVTISSFTAAEEGKEENLLGNNGAFIFSLSLIKGSSPEANVTNKAGEIIASQAYNVSIGTPENGSISSNKSIALVAETVTLTFLTDTGYQLDVISAYRTGSSATTVSLSGTGNIRTFTMPAYDVTVNTSFKKTADFIAVETAKQIVEASPFVAPQALVTTQAELLTWLVGKINTLISSTGITVISSDINISNFTAAIPGAEGNLLGTNGAFTFSLLLKKGSSPIANVTDKTGVISTTPVYIVSIGTFENGSVASNKKISIEDDIVTLTILPDDRYELDVISAYQTESSAISVFLLGTGNARTFTMPAYGVTVNASFKKTADFMAVEAALQIIETSLFIAPQAFAIAQADLLTYLVGEINTLISSTGVTLTNSDITIGNFNPATAGAESTPLGVNGSFSFEATVTKGIHSLTSSVISGTINATEWVSAQTPIIVTQPQSATFNVGNFATALNIAAQVSDEGLLSYQWYANTTNSNVGGTPLANGTRSYFAPLTLTTGTFYYYVQVTNTNANATGPQTATTTSEVATIVVSKISLRATNFQYDPITSTYNGIEKSLSISFVDVFAEIGAVTVKYNGSHTAPVNAGTYEITVDVAESSNNNSIVGLLLGNLEIEKAMVTITATDGSYIYGNTIPAANASVTGKPINGDDVNYSVEYQQKGVAVNPFEPGVYNVVVTPGSNYNYNVMRHNGILAINKITPNTPSINISNITYGETPEPFLTGGSNPGGADTLFVYAETLDRTFTTNVPTEAGNYWVRGVLTGTSLNHADTTFAVQFIIQPKSVEVVWESTSFVYNNALQVPTASAGTLKLTVTGAKTNAGVYTASASMANGNYALTNSSVQFNIHPKEVEVIWENALFVFNNALQVPTALADTLSLNIAGAQTNVGIYDASATCANSNFVLTNMSKQFNIEPKEVEVAWENTTFTYNNALQVPTASADTIKLIVTGAKTDVGNYSASASLANGNFVLTNTSVEFTIQPKEVEVFWRNTSLVYNNALQVPTALADTVNLTVTGAETNVGNYTASASITNGNYLLIGQESQFEIKPKPQTISIKPESTLDIKVVGNSYALVASTEDGIPVFFRIDKTTEVAYIDAANQAQLNLVKAGSVSITAYIDNPNYDAPEVSMTIKIENSTGINTWLQKELNASLRAYPNPVRASESIKLEGNAHENSTVSVYNLAGKLVNVQPYNNSETPIYLPIGAGTYLIRLGNATTKLMVK